MNTLILIISLVISGAALLGSIYSLNRMDKCTPHAIRISYIIIGVAALGVMLGPVYGKPPAGWVELLPLLACALFSFSNRTQSFCGVLQNVRVNKDIRR